MMIADKTKASNTMNFDLLTLHIYKHVCRENPDWYDFFMSYFAHMIQKPNDIPGTALFLLGDKGSGKSIVLEEVLANNIIPHHSLITRDLPTGFETEKLVGKHLCVLTEPTFGEDADAGYAAEFKNRITRAHQIVHEKGKNEKVIRNRVRYVGTSSGYFTRLFDMEDRRSFVLRVDPSQVGNPLFFQKMIAQLEENAGGGYGAFYQQLDSWPEPKNGWIDYLSNPPKTPWNDYTR